MLEMLPHCATECLPACPPAWPSRWPLSSSEGHPASQRRPLPHPGWSSRCWQRRRRRPPPPPSARSPGPWPLSGGWRPAGRQAPCCHCLPGRPQLHPTVHHFCAAAAGSSKPSRSWVSFRQAAPASTATRRCRCTTPRSTWRPWKVSRHPTATPARPQLMGQCEPRLLAAPAAALPCAHMRLCTCGHLPQSRPARPQPSPATALLRAGRSPALSPLPPAPPRPRRPQWATASPRRQMQAARGLPPAAAPLPARAAPWRRPPRPLRGPACAPHTAHFRIWGGAPPPCRAPSAPTAWAGWPA